MSAPYWLIEYREDGRTVGYLEDMQRGDGGFDVFMTGDPTKAVKFRSAREATGTIEDWAFQRTVPHPERFFVAEHVDCAGPVSG